MNVPCTCCRATAKFTITGTCVEPLCEACLESWLADWPEDGVRVESLQSSAGMQRALLRALCGAIKRNRELLDLLPEERDSIGAAEADEILEDRVAAQAAMESLRADLEIHVSA